MSKPKLALTAFLSHKYKAPGVNEYFFRLMSRSASVEFEVDVGSTATNVSRLERLVRDADAFIGIYPFDEIGRENPPAADLVNAARYFRLELDIAARARKPGLVFSDLRFRGIVSAPTPITQVGFDIQEITGGGSRPSSARFIKAFTGFCDHVSAARACALAEERLEKKSNLVGILLPPEEGRCGYSRDQIGSVLTAIHAARYDPVELPWPPVITPEWITKIRSLDWVVIDVGSISTGTGVVGYLHGEFKPSMRLLRVQEPTAGDSKPEPDLPLYTGFEVGYRKDILRWWNSDVLLDGLKKRITSLDAQRKRISTLNEALEYFRSAALRKEAVFVSYAGQDLDQAEDLVGAFRKRFQQVFDYRDGKSIRPGQPWIKEIFDQLAVSPIGVPLLSSAYIQSGNCRHELREMVARRDSNRLQIFPVKLSRTNGFEIPAELRDIQYARLWEYPTVDGLVDWIAANISH
jgi:hypothetical protein